MKNVQFESADIDTIRSDFAILGIKAEIVKKLASAGGVVIAHYDDWRSAEKLRTYLESYHCSVTAEGKINTLSVDGWDNLVASSRVLREQ
jgi:hypothetical protein